MELAVALATAPARGLTRPPPAPSSTPKTHNRSSACDTHRMLTTLFPLPPKIKKPRMTKLRRVDAMVASRLSAGRWWLEKDPADREVDD